MFGNFLIEEEEFKLFASTAPTDLVTFIFSLSKYHQKFKLTQWCKTELDKRNFDNDTLESWDEAFQKFYQLILTQDDI
jgi:hypothetical protein